MNAASVGTGSSEVLGQPGARGPSVHSLGQGCQTPHLRERGCPATHQPLTTARRDPVDTVLPQPGHLLWALDKVWLRYPRVGAQVVLLWGTLPCQRELPGFPFAQGTSASFPTFSELDQRGEL